MTQTHNFLSQSDCVTQDYFDQTKEMTRLFRYKVLSFPKEQRKAFSAQNSLKNDADAFSTRSINLNSLLWVALHFRSICGKMSELKVEHWNTEKDGPLNEKTMSNKLKSQGYSCTKYSFPPGTDFPDHTHSVSKKDSIISGQFRFAMLGKEVILQPGDMVVVPAGVVHNASVVGKESVIFFDATKS